MVLSDPMRVQDIRHNSTLLISIYLGSQVRSQSPCEEDVLKVARYFTPQHVVSEGGRYGGRVWRWL